MGKKKTAEEEGEHLLRELTGDLALDRDPALDKNYMNYPKYSKEAPFSDPVLRCDSCKKLVRTDYLNTHGSCPCGGRKMLEVRSLSQVEMAKIQQEFPDFSAVFTADHGDKEAFI